MKRDAASKKLEAIGVHALSALEKTAVASDDPGIRSRCNLLIPRILEAVIKRELASWNGQWQCGDQSLVVAGHHWWWGPTDSLKPGQFKRNRIKIVEITGKFVVANLAVEIGHFHGQTCKVIFQLDGDILHYCGSYKARSTGFRDGSGYYVAWKRVKK